MAVGKASVRYSQMLGSGILCVSVNGWHYVHLYRLVSFENIIKWGLGIAVHLTVVSLAPFFLIPDARVFKNRTCTNYCFIFERGCSCSPVKTGSEESLLASRRHKSEDHSWFLHRGPDLCTPRPMHSRMLRALAMPILVVLKPAVSGPLRCPKHRST